MALRLNDQLGLCCEFGIDDLQYLGRTDNLDAFLDRDLDARQKGVKEDLRCQEPDVRSCALARFYSVLVQVLVVPRRRMLSTD